MNGPFPGMDPWLEEPGVWVGVHPRMLVYIADRLQPLVGRRYVVGIEQRIYVATVERLMVPDVSVRHSRADSRNPAPVAVLDDAVEIEVGEIEAHEPYLEIRDLQSGEQVVTVVEVVSPSNKRSGAGRDEYLAKQRMVLASQANLVEIDLLRAGPHVLAVPEIDARRIRDYDYLVCIHTVRNNRKRFRVYPRTVRERLPTLRIPLAEGDVDVELDLQAVLISVYQAGAYANQFDYSRPCYPRLRPDDEAWAQERITAWRAANQA